MMSQANTRQRQRQQQTKGANAIESNRRECGDL